MEEVSTGDILVRAPEKPTDDPNQLLHLRGQTIREDLPKSKLGSPIFLPFKSVLNLSNLGLSLGSAGGAIGPLIALSLIRLPIVSTPPPPLLLFSGVPFPLPLLLFLNSMGVDPATTGFPFNSSAAALKLC